MNKLELLISCMGENAIELVHRSNIKCNCVIVDQCEKNSSEVIPFECGIIKNICTTERGLSNSRNMAINNASADYCLICDDDECFVDNLQENIVKTYSEIPYADVIVFSMSNFKPNIPYKIHEMKKYELLRVSSWMISFRLDRIKGNVYFDNKIGSGTGNGGGEEIKFLLDCKEKGLKIIYYPFEIGEVNHQESQWFKGYNEQYFYQRGATTKYYLGLFVAILYGLYFVLTKRKLYKSEISSFKAFKCLSKGIHDGIK